MAQPDPDSLQPRGSANDWNALDPANKSLADALRLSFRFLQVLMIVMIAGYFLTGYQRVSEQERGLRLVFGNFTTTEPLEPGAHLAWPYPIGEFILVPAAPQTIELNEEFWVGLRENERGASFRDLDRRFGGLVPGQDGSMITADSNLAHSRWRVTYRIIDPAAYQRNVVNAQTQHIVRDAVSRGVVLTAATFTLDEIIQTRDLMNGSVKAWAQEVLDAIESGISLESISCTESRPPRPVLDAYDAVNTASAQAAQQREEAQTRAKQRLVAMAGPAYPQFLRLIDEYEQLIDAGEADSPRGLEILDEFAALAQSPAAAGAVAQRIASARSEQTSIVQSLISEARLFRAFDEAHRENPALVTMQLWSDRISEIMARDFERFFIPEGADQVEILLNRDPRIERARRTRAAREQITEAQTGSGG